MIANMHRVISDLLLKVKPGLLYSKKRGMQMRSPFCLCLLFCSQFLYIVHKPLLFDLIPAPIAADL